MTLLSIMYKQSGLAKWPLHSEREHERRSHPPLSALKQRMRHSPRAVIGIDRASGSARSRSESDVMVLRSRRMGHRPVVVMWAILLLGHAGRCIRDQAPGDGHAICTDDIIDGMTNLFIANHPVYSASERPLMDSRDYNHLLWGSDGVYIPWQRDNNNSIQVITEVRV